MFAEPADYEKETGAARAPFTAPGHNRTEAVNRALDTMETQSRRRRKEEAAPYAPRMPADASYPPATDIPAVLTRPFSAEDMRHDVFAAESHGIGAGTEGDWDFSAKASAGYRNDYLRWNIAGDMTGGNPNILSELTYENMHIFQLGTEAGAVWQDTWRAEASFKYGWLVDGRVQDSDYLYDDRRGEFSRSYSDVDDDNVMDLSVGGGVQFFLDTDSGDVADILRAERLGVAILGGYSYHEQNLRMTNGFQDWPPTGSFSGLDSTYQSRWDGPWAGVELFGEHKNLSGGLRLEYHWLDYYAEADWNLRTDFQHPKSFEHEADGDGLAVLMDGIYRLAEDWDLNLDADMFFFSAGDGIDRTYFSSGAVVDTRFNEVEWISYQLMIGTTYHFGL